jgi:predicted GIY-YIG superfamily endonuclease
LAACTIFFVYLLASKPHGTLYAGVTTDLAKRVWEHKIKAVPGFTAQYNVDRLVWFEMPKLGKPPFVVKSRSRNGEGPGKSP